jgi:hypothetical protein
MIVRTPWRHNVSSPLRPAIPKLLTTATGSRRKNGRRLGFNNLQQEVRRCWVRLQEDARSEHSQVLWLSFKVLHLAAVVMSGLSAMAAGVMSRRR